MTVAVALFVTIYINYLEQVFHHESVLFDIKTVTASDYTLELKVKQLFAKFTTESVYAEEASLAVQFRSWLQQQLEYRLTRQPAQGYGLPGEPVRVAAISFSYDNAELIKILRERGELIQAAEWHKVKQCDKEIEEFTERNHQRLATPLSALITFQTEEGVQRALNCQQVAGEALIPGVKALSFKRASEPSDIIWENRN